MLVFALQFSSYTAIGFLITKRHCYDDQPISTPNFKLYLLGAYPVGVTELYKFFFMRIIANNIPSIYQIHTKLSVGILFYMLFIFTKF